jgi:hypothetical protein
MGVELGVGAALAAGVFPPQAERASKADKASASVFMIRDDFMRALL